MKRRLLNFLSDEFYLAATLDEGDKSTGLLVVSGGNEIRSGAFSGQSELAAQIARHGYPVFRFDRKGVGDSEGENAGFRESGSDIAAAVATFRAEMPHLRRVVAFGNCDAASALMLVGGLGMEALVLSNPWIYDSEVDTQTHTSEDVRERYAARLRDPRQIVRLLTGKVALDKLARGVASLVKGGQSRSLLAEEVSISLRRFEGSVTILLSGRDRTARAFAANWDKDDARIQWCDDASHGFAEPASREWLVQKLTSVLAQEEAREFDMR